MILHRGEPLRFENLVSLPSKEVGADTGGAENETPELDELVKRHIQGVLRLTGGKIHGPGGAGEVLGMNHGTLRSQMKSLTIPFRKKRKS